MVSRLLGAGFVLGLAGTIFTPRLFVALLLAAALGWWLRGDGRESVK